MKSQQTPSNGLAALTANEVRGVVQLESWQQLCHALHTLGTWPAGVWYSTSHETQPQGEVLMVLVDPQGGGLQLRQLRPRALPGPAPSDAGWRLQQYLGLTAAAASNTQVRHLRTLMQDWCPRVGSTRLCHLELFGAVCCSCVQATWAVKPAGRLHCSLHLAEHGCQLTIQRNMCAPARPGWRAVSPVGSAGASGPEDQRELTLLARYLGIEPSRMLLATDNAQFRRVELPPGLADGRRGIADNVSEAQGLVLLRQVEVRAVHARTRAAVPIC
jgi:hypothetical protein